jgi:hypothetical protein
MSTVKWALQWVERWQALGGSSSADAPGMHVVKYTGMMIQGIPPNCPYLPYDEQWNNTKDRGFLGSVGASVLGNVQAQIKARTSSPLDQISVSCLGLRVQVLGFRLPGSVGASMLGNVDAQIKVCVRSQTL